MSEGKPWWQSLAENALTPSAASIDQMKKQQSEPSPEEQERAATVRKAEFSGSVGSSRIGVSKVRLDTSAGAESGAEAFGDVTPTTTPITKSKSFSQKEL
jgi:hypothetical protein